MEAHTEVVTVYDFTNRVVVTGRILCQIIWAGKGDLKISAELLDLVGIPEGEPVVLRASKHPVQVLVAHDGR